MITMNIGDRMCFGVIDDYKFEAFFSAEPSSSNLNGGRIRIFVLWPDVYCSAPVLAIEGKTWKIKPTDKTVLDISKKCIAASEDFIKSMECRKTT